MNILDDHYIEFLGTQEQQYLRKASDWASETVALTEGSPALRGLELPWQKTHDKILLRPGEVTLWGGYNGHGKSQLLSHVMAWGVRQARWLVASLEMPPRMTCLRACRQASGAQAVSAQFVRDWLAWTDDRLWIYDQNDTVQCERILGMVHYAAAKLGCDHIILDSLMKCGFRGARDTIYTQQTEFVDRLCWAAKTNDVHIHLVHHMRKGEGTQSEYARPGKHDFRGAGELVDLVDNAHIVHRNKRKEAKIQKGEDVERHEPDATLECVKQRHGDWEGLVALWWDESGRYLESPTQNMFYPIRDLRADIENRREREAIQEMA